MKKKDFMIKVTGIDLFIVCILLIALLLTPAFQNLIAYYSILVYGVLFINMVVDLSVLILNKLKFDMARFRCVCDRCKQQNYNFYIIYSVIGIKI